MTNMKEYYKAICINDINIGGHTTQTVMESLPPLFPLDEALGKIVDRYIRSTGNIDARTLCIEDLYEWIQKDMTRLDIVTKAQVKVWGPPDRTCKPNPICKVSFYSCFVFLAHVMVLFRFVCIYVCICVKGHIWYFM